MRGYFRFVLCQWGASVASMIFIVIRYGYSYQTLWLNTLYVTELLLAQTLLLWLIVTLVSRQRATLARAFVTATATVTTGVLVALYVANITSNELWGTAVNGTLATEAGAHARGIAALLGIPPAALYSVLLLPLVGLYMGIYKRCSAGFVAEFLPVHQKRTMHTAIRFACAVLFSSYVGFYSALVFAHGAFAEYRGEPLCSLFMPASSPVLANSAHLAGIVQLDQETRAKYSVPKNFDKRNVILIVTDALRAFNLPMYQYRDNTAPFLASLVNDGTLQVIPRAFATCPESVCGITSTLSSRSYNHIAPGLYKLNDLLYDAGYNVNFILSGSHSWEGLRELYGESVHLYVDGKSFQSSVNDDRGVLAHLAHHQAFDGTPTFFFFHLMTTHGLGRTVNFSDEFTGRRWLAWKSKDYYDLSIKEADRVIQRIFTLLERKGYLQNSVAMIVSDHGEAFGEHGTYGHIHTIYQETMAIPLLIYDPHKKKYGTDTYATQLDVAPTIIDRLGLPVPETWQGKSLLRPSTDSRLTVHQTTTHPRKFAVYNYGRGKLYKLITEKLFPSGFAADDELYELTGDPTERHNIISSATPSLLTDMLGALVDYQKVELLPYYTYRQSP